MTEFVVETAKAEAKLGPVPEGAESIVRELVGRERDLPCFVRHEDAGGKCKRSAVVEVYGLNFCELHGAEVKAGALQELYEDASDFLHRLDNPQVVPPNPAALAVIRNAVGRFLDVELDTEEDEEAAIRQAYPVIPKRVEEDTVDFDYEDPARGFGPVEWNGDVRRLIHKIMRLAYEKRATWIVERLELDREHVTAQLSFALADYDERVGAPAV